MSVSSVFFLQTANLGLDCGVFACSSESFAHVSRHHNNGRISAPVVSFVAEANSAVTSGYSVTVSGLNFGVYSTTPTSTIGLSSCATASWASATSVICMLSMGEGVKHELRMTVAGVVGSRTTTFSYDGRVLPGDFGFRLAISPPLSL